MPWGIIKKIAKGAGSFFANPVISSAIDIGTGLYGANKAADAQRYAADQQRLADKEFAQMGVRWRAEDAKAAGIDPLAALGANIASPNPIGIGQPYVPNAIAKAGQNLSRSIQAQMTKSERDKVRKLELEGLETDLAIKKEELASRRQINNPGNPPMADAWKRLLTGDGPGARQSTPGERWAVDSGNPAREAGGVPDYGWDVTDTGVTRVLSEPLSDRMEEDMVGKIFWHWRNSVAARLRKDPGKPPSSKYFPMPKGWKWEFSRFRNEWVPKQVGKKWKFKPYKKMEMKKK